MSKNPAITPLGKNRRRGVKSNENHLALWLAMMAANELPRNLEVPGFAPETPHPRPWESIQSVPEWRALLQRVKRAKRKGELPYINASDENLGEAVWIASSVRVALLRIAQARPGDIIHIGWLALFPDRIRIESDGIMRIIRDGGYEQLIAALDGRNKEIVSQCPVCGRLFLKERKDRAVCSPGCRVRKSLSKHPDKRLDVEAKRARRDLPRDMEKRRQKREEEGRLRGSSSPHKRSPRPI
jgi:hypothetical protein